MWQVQITLVMRRCIWLEASLDSIERAVLRHVKDKADTRELSPYPDFKPRRLCISRPRDPARSYTRRLYSSVINNVVTLSQVLHIAQDDLFNYYSKMEPV